MRSSELSKCQQLMLEALELEYGDQEQASQVLSRPKSNKDRLKEADKMLKRWAIGYLKFDFWELKNDTGNSGGSVLGWLVRAVNKTKRIYDEVVFFCNDDEYQKLNAAFNKMPEDHRRVIYLNYIEFQKFIAKTCCTPEYMRLTPEQRNDYPFKKNFIKSRGYASQTYYRHVSRAKDCFWGLVGER